MTRATHAHDFLWPLGFSINGETACSKSFSVASTIVKGPRIVTMVPFALYFSRLKLHVPIPIMTAANPVKIRKLSAKGSWDEHRIRPRSPSTA